MSKIYKIDRTKFIDFINDEDISAATEDLKYDLKVSGEFILTAGAILDRTLEVPVDLLEEYNGSADYVQGSECELIYKQPFI